MKFVCEKFPSLSFYVGNKQYQFQAGIFDLSEQPEEDRAAIKSVLAKTHPSSGVQAEEEYFLPYKCPICSRAFQSLAGLNGHKPAHKTQQDIDNLSWREGGAPKNEA